MTHASRRTFWWLLAAIGSGILLILLAALALRYQPVDERWQRCGIGERSVTGLLLHDGALYAAANQFGSGDLWVSTDQCQSFEPWGLTSEAVWSVSRLARAGVICAGARERFTCQQESGRRQWVAAQDVYWALETSAGVAMGGYPLVLHANEKLDRLQATADPGYASGGGALVDGRLFVATKPLLISDDGGLSFRRASLRRTSNVVTGIGTRVYVGGGTFGGFLVRSDDHGTSFRDVTLPGSQPEVLLLPGADPDLLLLGTHGDVRPGGLFLSRDGGQAWQNLGCPGAEIHSVAMDQDYLYCGARSLVGNAGLWRIERSLVDL